MSNEHLTYFKIENFKRFDSLELTDIGQFNLIVGDNNVGKTSLLESLVFSQGQSNFFRNFHKILNDKGVVLIPTYKFKPDGTIEDVKFPKENFFIFFWKNLELPMKFFFEFRQSHLHFIPIKSYWNENQFCVNIDLEFDTQKIQNNRISFWHGKATSYQNEVFTNKSFTSPYSFFRPDLEETDLPFLTISEQLNKNLAELYFQTIGLSRQANRALIEMLKIIIPNIEAIEGRRIGVQDHIMIGVEKSDEYFPLATFGDGSIRATRILLEIIKNTGKRLMIDEIDTGIHHSRLKHFLKTIFVSAVKNDVQLFMTTHSLECQEAFAEVFKNSEMVEHQSKVRNYTLFEKADGNIDVSVLDFATLEKALEIGYETRGGR